MAGHATVTSGRAGSHNRVVQGRNKPQLERFDGKTWVLFGDIIEVGS